MKIGIIGLGHVGRNIERRLVDHGAQVVTHDRDVDDAYPEVDLAACDFVVVCVGTPNRPDGTTDLSDVVEAVDRAPCKRILLRSTVPPGTTESLSDSTGKDICFSPEYVGETAFSAAGWTRWADDTSFQILGGRPPVTRWFAERLTSIHGPEAHIFQCTSTEAEIAKYMENSYFAVKVTFVNEFFDLCESLGADWHTVREAWLLDPRVERDHTAVFADSRGYGGRCLPKDVESIVSVARLRGVSMPLMSTAHVANAERRRGKPNPGWSGPPPIGPAS